MSDLTPPLEQTPARNHSSSYARLMHSRNFVALVAGISMSGWGDAIFDVAILWFVYTGTRSALETAGVVVAERLARTIIGPVAGTFVDRWDRRRTMIVTDLLRALIVFAIGVMALRNALLPAVAVVGVFGLQAAALFFRPARTALMRMIVQREDLVTANGLYSSVGQVNGFLASGVAGIVVAALGATWSILLDAASFVFSIAGVAMIDVPNRDGRPERSANSPRASGVGRSFMREAIDGCRFALSDPVLVGITLVAAAATAGAAAFPALVPAIVQTRLHAGVATYGFINAASMAGAAVGGLAAGWIERRLSLGRVLVLALVVFGLAVAGVGLSRSIAITLALFALLSLASALIGIPFSALVQARVPDEYMARTSSFLGAIEGAAAPISALVGGWLADRTSPTVVLSACGAWVVLTAALVLLNPQIREVRVSDATG